MYKRRLYKKESHYGGVTGLWKSRRGSKGWLISINKWGLYKGNQYGEGSMGRSAGISKGESAGDVNSGGQERGGEWEWKWEWEVHRREKHRALTNQVREILSPIL